MKISKLLYLMATVLLLVSCEDDDSFSTSKSNLLLFSTDTVKVDTVFSNVPSSTRSLWVYNHTNDGIRCSSIQLERGNQSGFRVNVDGTYLSSTLGYQVQNVEIRKGDSIRVFVEVTTPQQNQANPQKIEDNLIFNLESGASQKVNLDAWSWDATRLSNLVIKNDTTISSSKPIVVYGGIKVNEGATLTLAAGTTLYFHNDAGIVVFGTLKSIGTAQSPVILRGDRLDNMFDYLPYDYVSGQWQGIHLNATSYNNIVEYTDLHSAYNGIVADSCDLSREKLTLSSSTIHNCQGAGVSLTHCKATIENTQITNTLNDCLLIAGGDVTVNNCTLAQFYPFDSKRGAAIHFSAPLQNMICRNTLITGYADDVMTADKSDVFNYQFEDCIIRTPKITTDDSLHFTRVLFENPEDTAKTGKKHFLKIDIENLRYDFRLDSISPAIGRANTSTALPLDRNGLKRDDKPDVGAYEWKK
jgi:hypothetical protein